MTQFLEVPGDDWLRIEHGEKTEFRTTEYNSGMTVDKVRFPTPVVLYADRGSGKHWRRLMVMDAHRYEPLFNISDDPEGVAREGFESYDHFRRYWRAKSGSYNPMQMVHVWQVHRPEPGDYAVMGLLLFKRLYGDYLVDLEPAELQS